MNRRDLPPPTGSERRQGRGQSATPDDHPRDTELSDAYLVVAESRTTCMSAGHPMGKQVAFPKVEVGVASADSIDESQRTGSRLRRRGEREVAFRDALGKLDDARRQFFAGDQHRGAVLRLPLLNKYFSHRCEDLTGMEIDRPSLPELAYQKGVGHFDGSQVVLHGGVIGV
jgi:hypothetical protein